MRALLKTFLTAFGLLAGMLAQADTSNSEEFYDDGRSCRQLSAVAAVRLEACRIEMKALKCDSLPADAPKRNCLDEAINPMPLPTEVAVRYWGCLKGAFGATIGATVEQFSSAWTDAEVKARYFSPAVYESCTNKEKAVSEAARHQKKPDEKDLEVLRNCKNRLLEEFPDLKSQYSSQLDESRYDDISTAVHERIREIKEREPSLAKFIKDHPHDFHEALDRETQKLIKSWGAKFVCAPLIEQEKMFCEAATVVIMTAQGVRQLPKMVRAAAREEAVVAGTSRQPKTSIRTDGDAVETNSPVSASTRTPDKVDNSIKLSGPDIKIDKTESSDIGKWIGNLPAASPRTQKIKDLWMNLSNGMRSKPPISQAERRAQSKELADLIAKEMESQGYRVDVNSISAPDFPELDGYFVEVLAAPQKDVSASALISGPQDKLGFRIMIVPTYQAALPHTGAATITSGKNIKFILLPPQRIIEGNVRSIVLNDGHLHEIYHAAQRQKLRSGKDSPYYIEVRAEQGEKVTVAEGYETYMNFDEMGAYQRTLVHQKAGVPDFLGRENKEMVIGRARTLISMSDESRRLIERAMTNIKADPQSVKFEMDSDYDKVKATLPLKTQDGKVKGHMTVYLVKAKGPSNTSENLELLKQYLNEAKTTAAYHQRSAARYINESLIRSPE